MEKFRTVRQMFADRGLPLTKDRRIPEEHRASIHDAVAAYAKQQRSERRLKIIAYCEPCLLALGRGEKPRWVIGVGLRRGGLPGSFLHIHFEISVGAHWPFAFISARKWVRYSTGKAGA